MDVYGRPSLAFLSQRVTRGDPFHIARRPSTLHLPWFLPSGLQSRREGIHARHACARCTLANGAEIHTSMVSRLSLNIDGLTDGVVY